MSVPGNNKESFEQAWRITDFSSVRRSDWLRLCRGERRETVRERFLAMAEGDAPITRAERLALYQAAHAVLPLHGDSLISLARLMTETGTATLEWADVLVEALAQTPRATPLAAQFLAALRQTFSQVIQSHATPSEQRQSRTLIAQVISLGYNPQWLKPWPPL